MRIVAFILSFGTYCTALGQLNDCYMLFPKSIKSVFILVQCNTSLRRSYVAHSYVTVVCVIGWIWGKTGLSVLPGCLCICISRRARIFHEFTFDNKVLKTFVDFWIWHKLSKFERRRIQTLSHPYQMYCILGRMILAIMGSCLGSTRDGKSGNVTEFQGCWGNLIGVSTFRGTPVFNSACTCRGRSRILERD